MASGPQNLLWVDVPARQGQRVALLLDARPVAFINFSTEQYVNLVALNQFELFGAAEVFAFAALLIAAGFTAPAGVVVLLLGTVAYGLVKNRARRHWFRETFALVEAQIRRTIARPPAALTHDDVRPAWPGHPAADQRAIRRQITFTLTLHSAAFEHVRFDLRGAVRWWGFNPGAWSNGLLIRWS
jgi:hypothetical protein